MLTYKRSWFALALATMLASTRCLAVEVFFTPSLECEDRIVKAINQSKTEIVAVVNSLSNARIVNALKRAKRRGVSVQILTDRAQAASARSRVLELVQNHVDLKLHSRHSGEQNRFAIFDGKLAVSGSYNWTQASTLNHSENCLILPEATAVAAYKKRFRDLWHQNSYEHSRAALAALEERGTTAYRATASGDR